MDSSDFVILAVSIDEDINEAKKVFSGKLQVKSRVFTANQPSSLVRISRLDVIPTSTIIDREGHAMGLLRSNIDWDEPKTDMLIKLLVSGTTTVTLISDKEQHSQIQ